MLIVTKCLLDLERFHDMVVMEHTYLLGERIQARILCLFILKILVVLVMEQQI